MRETCSVPTTRTSDIPPTSPPCADSAHIALERIPAEIDAIGVSQIPEAG